MEVQSWWEQLTRRAGVLTHIYEYAGRQVGLLVMWYLLKVVKSKHKCKYREKFLKKFGVKFHKYISSLYVFHPEVLSNTIWSIEMYQSKHNSILLPINIGIGLHVSTPTESSSGPQDKDPSDKVSLLHCGIHNAYKYILWYVEACTFVEFCSEHANHIQCRYLRKYYSIIGFALSHMCFHIILRVVDLYWGWYSAWERPGLYGIFEGGRGWRGAKVVVKACDASMQCLLLYLNSTSAVLVLSTGIGIFLWHNTK